LPFLFYIFFVQQFFYRFFFLSFDVDSFRTFQSSFFDVSYLVLHTLRIR
jgi:hypothetical protein